LLAGWKQKRGLLKMLDVGVHGAGRVGKSFADSITIRYPVIKCLVQKIITTERVAQKKRDLQRKPTVVAGTIRIVANDGKTVDLCGIMLL